MLQKIKKSQKIAKKMNVFENLFLYFYLHYCSCINLIQIDF